MTSATRRAWAGCLLATLVMSGARAADKGAEDKPARQPLTLEDLWKVQRLGAPSLSPDGKTAVVEVTTYSMEENNSTSDLWLINTDGSGQKQLTTHPAKDSGPVWSPDGKQIAFTSQRTGDVSQVYLIPATGGEARKLTDLPMSPSGLKWSNDSKTIYCIVWTWPDTPDDASYKKRAQEKKESKVQAYIIDDALFRVWDNWIADGKRPVVFAIDAATGKHRNLFAKTKLFLPLFAPSAKDYDVSPDGKEICFTAETTKELGLDFNSDLYTMSTDGAGNPRNITEENKANDGHPAYSPDGRSIAFTRQTIKYFYADRARMMLHNRETKHNRELTAKLDRSCGPPTWDADSKATYTSVEDKGYVRICRLPVDLSESTYLTGEHTDQSPDLDRSGRTMSFLRSDFNRPSELWAMVGGGKPKRIDKFNDDLTQRWKLGKVEEVYFKGADDEDVQMWIVYPPDFDPAKKYPLLQVVHGGPHNGITTDFHYRWNLQLFAAKGYVVGCINFHGSSGFGQKFTDSITGDMGTKPFTDIMKGTDWLEAKPFIDKTRTTAAGASYGGYMMSWINGHTDRFKALVCHAGVYNWHSMMASDFVRSRERPLGALPWGDLERIDKQTPQRFSANFKTPTLVMHGEKDYRVPVTQGFEFYNTLRIKGVPTRLVYFPDENHWVSKPQNSRLWHREFFAWLEKYAGHGTTSSAR